MTRLASIVAGRRSKWFVVLRDDPYSDTALARVDTLRDRLRDLQEAARSADPAAVEQAVSDARDAARSTAEACGLPADQFLAG